MYRRYSIAQGTRTTHAVNVSISPIDDYHPAEIASRVYFNF